jgi:hypothetical protein
MARSTRSIKQRDGVDPFDDGIDSKVQREPTSLPCFNQMSSLETEAPPYEGMGRHDRPIDRVQGQCCNGRHAP